MKKIKIENINDETCFYNVYGFHHWWNRKSEYSYLNTPRPNHGILYVMCDELIVEYPDGKTETFYRGNLLYIPQNLHYKLRFPDKEGNEDLIVNFSIRGDVKFFDKITLLVSHANEKYTDEMNSIISDYQRVKNSYLSIMSAFYRLMNYIREHTEKKNIINQGHEKIQPAVTYIDSHINGKIYIPKLAKLCCTSESCFRKDFKSCTGQTPNNYIRQKRLEKARKMLKNDDIPISSIVSGLGFYDNAYFYKLFVAEYGMTPIEFRKKYVENV